VIKGVIILVGVLDFVMVKIIFDSALWVIINHLLVVFATHLSCGKYHTKSILMCKRILYMKLLRNIILEMAMISGQMISAKIVEITSPNGNHLFSVSDEGGVLRYHFQWQGENVIQSSLLGIKANTDWQSGLSIQDAVSRRYHQSWHPVYGEMSMAKDNYVEWKLIIKKKQVAKELKFFDDLYTTWDDTKVLEGAPGQYIRMARRHGRNGSSGPLPIMIVVRLPSVLISWMAICHI